MVERFMAVLAYVLILAIIFIIGKLREFYREKNIKELVSWIVVDNTLCVRSHDMPLWMYVHNAQNKPWVKEEYRISSDKEWGFAKEIIQEFQNDLMQAYFKGNVRVRKSKYVITEEYYFMYSLEGFLESHLDDYKFLGYDMRTYGSNRSYCLTDFSIAYRKLYYIVYLFCKNCKPLNESGMRYSNERLVECIEAQIKRKEG